MACRLPTYTKWDDARLRPGAQHLSPLAPAKEMPFPSAASAHRDGYADPEDEKLQKVRRSRASWV